MCSCVRCTIILEVGFCLSYGVPSLGEILQQLIISLGEPLKQIFGQSWDFLAPLNDFVHVTLINEDTPLAKFPTYACAT